MTTLKSIAPKKAYVSIITMMASAKYKKMSVKDLLEDAAFLELVQPKVASETVRYDKDGKAVEIFCYYHKKWEVVSKVEYGSKSSTKSGLNTMCKVGTNQWTKQQSVAKKLNGELLDGIADGSIEPSKLKELMAKIEEDRKAILPLPLPRKSAKPAKSAK